MPQGINPQNADLRPRAWSADGRWTMDRSASWRSKPKPVSALTRHHKKKLRDCISVGLGLTRKTILQHTLQGAPCERLISACFAHNFGRLRYRILTTAQVTTTVFDLICSWVPLVETPKLLPRTNVVFLVPMCDHPPTFLFMGMIFLG